jgi:hypothetical protein
MDSPLRLLSHSRKRVEERLELTRRLRRRISGAKHFVKRCSLCQHEEVHPHPARGTVVHGNENVHSCLDGVPAHAHDTLFTAHMPEHNGLVRQHKLRGVEQVPSEVNQ